MWYQNSIEETIKMNTSNDYGIHNTGQTFLPKPSPNNTNTNNNDINPNPKSGDLTPPASLFHFPSPHIHYEDDTIFFQYFYDLLHQQQPSINNDSIAETAINMADLTTNIDVVAIKRDCKIKKSQSVSEPVPRKRTSRKDRHSKINTAHGPRDRRMRLSLDVARKFFDLQDMLEFDKASKTVEWLLTQAKASIKELARGRPNMMRSCSANGANSPSTTSDCEVVSGIIDDSTLNGSQQAGNAVKKAKSSCTKEKNKRASRRTVFHPLVKESREKARARARERTREKRRLGQSNLCVEKVVNHDLNRLGPWSAFETGKQSGSHSHNMNPSFEVPAEVEEPSSHPGTREEFVGDSLVVTRCWSPSPIFSFQQDTGISHQHQFTDFQFYTKAWEAYNNMNL